MAQLRLLALLAEQPRRSTDIASFFDQAPRTVTQAIDALEQNGLVSRSPAADDRRSKLVQITDAGGPRWDWPCRFTTTSWGRPSEA